MTDIRTPIVHTFMTHDMPDDAIWELFTGREHELAQVMEAVRLSLTETPGNIQHVVLYGARGFGKSFMTRRIQLDIARTPGVAGLIRYLLLPEEQHNLQRSPHALLDTLTALLNQGEEGDDAFAAAAFRWPREGEEAWLWDAAAARLESAIDAALPEGGLVVAAIENFDVLLATLFGKDEDEQRLRLWLGRPGNRLMLLATATGTVDMDYERPLFQAFQSVRLSPWSAEDCLAYFDRKRRREGRPPLKPRQVAKARAVAEFIGGTPRLAQLLADVVDTGDALTVAETMSALADRLAEYYRRRIEDLSPLARGLLDALIRGGEPESQTGLARRVGADGQSAIARVMTDLQTADIIRGRPAPDGKDTLYSVNDRVFAHYYRLRQGSRVAQATPLATILDFLRGFYSRDERRAEMLRYLEAGRPAEARLFGQLAVEAGDEPAPRDIGAAGQRMVWYMDAVLPSEPDQTHPNESSNAQMAVVTAIARAQKLCTQGQAGEAAAQLEIARDAAIDDASRLAIGLELAMLHERFSGDQAVVVSDLLPLIPLIDAVAAPELGSWARLWASWALLIVKRPDDANTMLEHAVDQARRASPGTLLSALIMRGQVLVGAGQVAEAANVAAEAVMLAADSSKANGHFRALCLRVRTLQAADKTDEAMAVARETLPHLEDAEGDDGEFLMWLASTLRDGEAFHELDTMTERGLAVLDPAVEGDARVTLLEQRWAALYHLDRFVEAAAAATAIYESTRVAGDDFRGISALGARALCRLSLSEYASAWDDAVVGDAAARRTGTERWVAFYMRLKLEVATRMIVPAIVDHYAGMLAYWDAATETTDVQGPTHHIDLLFIAAARAGEWAALDALLARERARFAAADHCVYIFESDGEAFARFTADAGRAAGYLAAAELLPRLTAFMASLPVERRDDRWLPDFIAGFAANCRDPGLLRDIATLMTSALESVAAPAAAKLLDLLAAMDEAADPERALARVDPDLATVARRLRGLSDPVDIPQRSRRRNRKQRG